MPKKPKPKKRGPRKGIIRKRSKTPQWVRDMLATPEMTARRLEGLRKWREANPGQTGRAKGQPDGVRKRHWVKMQVQIAAKAERAVEIMAEKKLWVADNDVAEKAMKAAIEILETPGENRNKLQAAKVILDFVQTKPVVKNETTLKTAEEFLSALNDEEPDDSKP